MHEEPQDDSSTPQIYQFKPENWLHQIHATADLGYAGIFPPHPGQEEDVLSVRAVKYGFATDPRVSAEAFSAKAVIEGFHSDEVFFKLEELMTELFARRADRLPVVPPSTFRLPTRVTLNDAKRRAWFRDLANPDVPLHKLGKSVPHGAKGHDLLDLLHTNNVAIPRAVWFLRVFGANEVAGLRNKPSYNPTQYSIDWANVVTGYMKKQLLDIALPSPPRAGLNIKQTFKGVLTDAETRERWISRFSYCLHLLRHFYAEGLVDKRTFLIWLVQQISICNLAQAGFVVRLADEYISDVSESRALSRAFVDACLNKLHEIRSSGPAQACLVDTETLLNTLIQRMCLSAIDPFISPRLWISYSALLSDVLTGQVTQNMGTQHVEQGKVAIQAELLDHLNSIKVRNEAMLLQSFSMPALLGSAVSDVKLLNSISEKTNLEEIVFFDWNLDDAKNFARKIDVLLTWSVTSLQYGHHRPFAAVSLLSAWQEKLSERANRRDLISPQEFLQDQLFDWLDLSPAARSEENINTITLLYGNLIERGLFCYATYIQRLVARGEPGLSLAEGNRSHHTNFIRHIPLLDSNPSLLSQRRVLLYGVRVRQVPEEANERQIRREIRNILPDIFGGENLPRDFSRSTLLSSCNTFAISPRFEQVRVLKQWLLPILQSYMTRGHSNSSILLQTYSLSVEIMALAKSFDCIQDLMVTTLRNIISTDIIMSVVDHLHRYADIWQCMGSLSTLVVELDTAQQALKVRGHQSRLPFDLLELDGGRYLAPISRDRINSEIVHFTLALRPVTPHSERVPDILSDIFRLEEDFDPDFPSRLANSLWIKYRTSPEWGWKVWDNALTSLQRMAASESSTGSRDKYAASYGLFLWHIDQHLASGLDEEVLHWLTLPGSSQVGNFSSEMWNALSAVLIYLVARRSLRITTVLTGLVFPAWQKGASMTAEDQHHEDRIATYVRAANSLCEALLLQRNHSDDPLLANTHHNQCIESRQQMVYSEPFFSTFISKIPLLIHLENNACLPEDVKFQTGHLRCWLCQEESFRQGAFRNLDSTREAFEKSLTFSETNDDLGKSLITGLRHILCSNDEDTDPGHWLPSAHQFFSPWKLAVTSIHLQLILKELGRALNRESTREHALSNLERVSRELFSHRITREEAYCIGEVTRGVDDAVLGKLVASGLRRIVEILADPAVAVDGSPDKLNWANEVLRAILCMAGPPDSESPIPGFEPILHEHLLGAMQKKLTAVHLIFASEYDGNTIMPAMITLLRLLQFTLGFRGTWNVRAKEEGISISKLLFRLVLKTSAGSDHEISIYPVILDTLYFLLDELPCDTKNAFDPFRNYPEFVAADIPADVALEHRRQVLALTTQLSPCASVSDLVTSSRDNHDDVVFGNPVINRPWEWMEYLGDPITDTKEENKDGKEKENLMHSFKNAGAISLEMFGAKITGDCIIPNLSEEVDRRMESRIREFEDGLFADTLFRRDWRETRVVDISKEVSGPPGGYHQSTNSEAPEKEGVVGGYTTKRLTMGSPDHASGNHLADSTSSEMVDSGSNSTVSSKTLSKRKIDNLSDNDLEVEGSVPVPSEKKRGKLKAGSRGKGKK